MIIENIKKWIIKQGNISRKTGGLAEKEQSVKRKTQVAMAILDRRKESITVSIERRKQIHA